MPARRRTSVVLGAVVGSLIVVVGLQGTAQAAVAPAPAATVVVPAPAAPPTATVVRLPHPKPPAPPVKKAAPLSAATKVLREAASLAGTPYQYGGAGPSTFDCSGYTAWVYRVAVGINLPHSSAQQYAISQHISRAQLQPGDLIFFTSGGAVYHVAIYAGNGMIWHAPHTGAVVRLESIFDDSWVAGRFL